MKFELGKYYEHGSGQQIAILGAIKTTLYGWTLVAEENTSWTLKQIQPDGNNDCVMAEEQCKCALKPVTADVLGGESWIEITEEKWLENFTD